MSTIAVVGTLDTKGSEHAYLADCIRQAGYRVLMINVGTGGPPTVHVDIDRDQIRFEFEQQSSLTPRIAGEWSPAIKRLDTPVSDCKLDGRGKAIAEMALAAPVMLRKLYEQNEIQGVISMGGSGGTSIATAAMRALPLGFPKVMVSTMAGGDVSQYVDGTDILMFPSIVDVSGKNRILLGVTIRAAAVVTAMVAANELLGEKPLIDTRPVIVASMFGNTTQCVQNAAALLENAGYEVIVFHATGNGGRAMESLIAAGWVVGVLDITTTEWADELVGGVMPGGNQRLEAAARTGIPTIVAPGCLDMVNFRERDSVPERFAGRKFYQHNPQITLMRTTPEECLQLGEIIAGKLNQSTGPVYVLFPKRAVSVISAIGQPFHDPIADEALLIGLRDNLRNDIPFEVLDCEINDPMFAERCVHLLLEAIASQDGNVATK